LKHFWFVSERDGFCVYPSIAPGRPAVAVAIEFVSPLGGAVLLSMRHRRFAFISADLGQQIKTPRGQLNNVIIQADG